VLTVKKSVGRQYRGKIVFSAFDKAGNEAVWNDGYEFVIDTRTPVITLGNSTGVSSDKDRIYYDSEGVNLTISVNEANFYPDIVKIRVSKDGGKSYGEPFTLSDWNLVTADTYQSSFTLTDEAEYKVKVECTDKSGNKDELTSQYTYVVDKSSSYIVAAADGKSRTLKVTVREPNFTPSGIILDSFKATDINGNAIDRDSVKSRLVTALKNASNWSTGNSSDEHIFTFSGFDDGIYDIVLSCKDRSGNLSNKAATGRFAVDTTAPYGVAVAFSEPVNQFGREKYYNSNTDTIKVTFIAFDDVCGVDSFIWEYNRAQGASLVNKEKYEQQTVKAVQDKTDKSKFTATVTLLRSEADQIRGSITVTAYDTYKNTANKTTDSNIIINDTVSPLFDEIVYSEPTVSGEDGIFYGKSTGGKIEARLTITEANFVSSEVKISVSKDGGEYTSVDNVKWTDGSDDSHTAVFTLNGDGAYIIKAEYTDRSANKMKTYQSAVRVIDTVSPVISVKFDDNIPVTVADGTQYYAKSRTATVTVTEHNFS
ncbi:MAG: Ig-like domain-containing protein, partial [Huintestinicola sp.]